MSSSPYWAIAQTENQRETIAAYFLARADFETYLPRIRIRRGRKSRIVPLFPAYIFVRIVERWHVVESTIGVTRLVMSSGMPARLRDDVIDQIRGRESNGLIKLPPAVRLRRGDRVAIAKGSFHGHVALFDGMSASDRVSVLLELLGRKVKLELAIGDVAPAGQALAG
jgi:transcriptional antiterminator RfaH